MTELFTSFMSDLYAFVQNALDWVGSLFDVIVASPVLLVLVIAMPIVGFAVGLMSRLIRA